MIYNVTAAVYSCDSIKVAYEQLFDVVAYFCLLCCIVIYCECDVFSAICLYIF